MTEFWLGKAHLAMRIGDFAEAVRWLDRCLARRPEDPAVWRMKLETALASEEPDEVRRALPHLPVSLEPENRAASLRAWLAKRQGDLEAERKALKQQIELNPADAHALDRLAILEAEAGHTSETARIRASIRTIDQDRKKYIALLASASPESSATELARLALRLGRRFDATRWAALGDRREARDRPGEQSRRVEPTPRSLAQSEGSRHASLAAVLPEFFQTPAGTSQRPVEMAQAVSVTARFTDDAQAAGLTFIQENGGGSRRLIPPVTASGGVGLIDFDNDGWLDVYCVQGGKFPPDVKSSRSADRLFRNRGDGTFEDVTATSRIGSMPGGYGHGVAVGDYDNDGHADLFVTRWRPTPFIATGEMEPSRMPPKRPVWRATATGPRRRPLPTSTATAISTSTCAIT